MIVHWTDEDIDTLSRYYPNTPNQELPRIFMGRFSIGDIVEKAREMKLKKARTLQQPALGFSPPKRSRDPEGLR